MAQRKPQWRNRITGYGEEAPDQLLANPGNWRTHPANQQDALAGVLSEVGIVQNVIVNQRTGYLVDGHLRVMLAMRNEQPTIPVTYVDLSEAEEAEILATLDPIAALAAADAAKLGDLLESVSSGDAAVQQMLSDLAEREGVLDALGGTQGLTDPDDVPEPPVDPITQPGGLWLLGRHRLLCGDSTVESDVRRLMAGEKADMVFTDPPWNVAYGENMPGANAIAHRVRTILNDKMGREAWREFLAGITRSLTQVTKPGAPLYCVMGASEWPEIDGALRAGGFHWSSTIIWAKDQLVLSRKDYHTQYEPIWYGWDGHAARLVELEDRKQSDLWQIARPKVSDLHPTTKPVELVARAIENSSRATALVVDLFGGSGSTLIACEEFGRTAYLMELDPIYCDVIVRRWEQFTGETASLECVEAMAAD